MDHWVDSIGNWHAEQCDGTKECGSCDGYGDEPTDPSEPCGECDGQGTVVCTGCYR